MCSPRSVFGDIGKGLGQAGHQLGQWGGDVEHAYSQLTHIKPIRDILFAGPAIAAGIAAPELIPGIAGAAGGAGGAVSAADMAAMDAGISADLSSAVAPELAATSADIAAGIPGAAAAGTAAAGALPEITVAGTPLASGAPLTGDISYSTAAPALYAAGGAGNPAATTGGVAPDQLPGFTPFDPSVISPQTSFDIGTSGMGGGGPASLFQSPDAGAYLFDQPFGDATAGAGGGGGGDWLSQLGKTLKSPRGMLTAASLASSLYGLLNKPQLPGAAKTALGAAGPAVSQAQAMIASGGQGSPLWGQQKAGIDAQIDQQIQNMSRAIQQTAQNTSSQGANSAAVQAQIAEMTSRLNVTREQMYTAAQQQNVSNAVAELTGANQTLMNVAELQFQEDQAAQQLARQIGLVTGNLASLWPSTPT